MTQLDVLCLGLQKRGWGFFQSQRIRLAVTHRVFLPRNAPRSLLTDQPKVRRAFGETAGAVAVPGSVPSPRAAGCGRGHSLCLLDADPAYRCRTGRFPYLRRSCTGADDHIGSCACRVSQRRLSLRQSWCNATGKTVVIKGGLLATPAEVT